MAGTDPMVGGATIALNLTEKQQLYLRRVAASCKEGREDDLRTYPEHSRAGRWRADADVYTRLIVGLDARQIVPDADVRRLVRELALAIDREEEYERIVFEHDALAALGEQIGAEQ